MQIGHLRGPRVEWEDLVPILEKIFVAQVGDLNVGEFGKAEESALKALKWDLIVEIDLCSTPFGIGNIGEPESERVSGFGE